MSNSFSTVLGAGAVATVLMFGATQAQVAYTETLPHVFRGKDDGASPQTGLLADAAGNLYGTASGGRNSGSGVIFELVKPAPGGSIWTESILYTFPTCKAPQDCKNGSELEGLTFDVSGNLYGVAKQGGSTNSGTLFKLSQPTQGTTAWTFALLHTFKGGADGAAPVGRLALDGAGNLYGATKQGGLAGSGCFTYGCGTVYELMPPTVGQTRWTKVRLHDFTLSNSAIGPSGGMIFDNAGNLYGTIYDNNSIGGGQVYELSPPPPGKLAWIETTLWSFSGTFGEGGVDGAGVQPGLIFDKTGNLFGATYYGGEGQAGTVFELSPPSQQGGSWTENVLWQFSGLNGALGGAAPNGDLVLDPSGNLYGTTIAGGAGGCNGGTVFQLTPGEAGVGSSLNTLYSFAGCSHGASPDGAQPFDGVILDAAGDIYGTNSAGGAFASGTVFQLTP